MAEPLFNMSNFYDLLINDRPEEALAQLTPNSSSDPRVQGFIAEMMKTEQGRELLMRHRDLWEKRGIPLPTHKPTDTEMIDAPGTSEADDGEGSVKR